MIKGIFGITMLALLVVSAGLWADSEEKATVPDVTFPDSVLTIINNSYETVKPMLMYSCFDCHSNQTNEPWYYNMPLVGGWVQGHVKEGREHLDFTDGFPFKGKGSQLELLHELREEVEEGEMPLLSYRLTHWGRLIEGDKQDSLFAWVDSTIGLIEPYYFPAEDAEESDED